jgi:hypothetical protein
MMPPTIKGGAKLAVSRGRRMDYLLSALGASLASPLVQHVPAGSLEAAQGAARRMLAANPACEGIEIFHGGRFVTEVSRRACENPRGDALRLKATVSN